MERRDNIERLRKEKPEQMKEQNIKAVKAFRQREKEIKQDIQTKLKIDNAKQILANAIKARKARVEVKEKQEDKKIVGDILNDI